MEGLGKSTWGQDSGTVYSHISQGKRDVGHPAVTYLPATTVSLAPMAGTVRPTTVAIWRTCAISSSN